MLLAQCFMNASAHAAWAVAGAANPQSGTHPFQIVGRVIVQFEVRCLIAIQRPDAVLPTLGGQTALNAAVALHDLGVLHKYNVELIGANIDAIRAGEDRERFKEIVTGLGAEVPASQICRDLDECLATAASLKYPVVVRPSFTLGGLGSGIAQTETDLRRIAGAGLDASPTHEVLGAALGTGVQYYWRPSIERGLMRTTLSEGNCDLWLDMASDTEGAVVLFPLYRSTFVLVYRNDMGIDIKTLDDPALRKLRIGVFQVSAIRQALAEHHVVENTVIHYLSHNADIVADNQPSYQVQQVIDGTIDVAAAWGPMAGYYQKVLRAPLIIQPANLLEDQVPMEFNMTLAVPRGRPDIKAAVATAVAQHKGEIQQILTDYGVPLIKCDECTVSGDLPSHGPYAPPKPEVETAAESAKIRAARMADLKKWLAQGANPDDELNNAIVANDIDRVSYLLRHGAHANSHDGEGYHAPDQRHTLCLRRGGDLFG